MTPDVGLAEGGGVFELETRLWSIIDADGLGDVPSDICVAVEQLARAARNRDMWKGQCERQANQLRAHRALASTLQAMVPLNVSLDNPHWSDETVLPCDFTLGELRALRAAVVTLRGDAA